MRATRGILPVLAFAAVASAQGPPTPDTLLRICRLSNPPICTPSIRAGARGVSIPDHDGQPWFEFMVDTAAREIPGSFQPEYPPALRGSGLGGEVVAQFVVDTLGRVETRTIRILRSPHASFEAAVREAIPVMRFTPAMAQLRKVRQLVQWPFVFVSPR